MEVLWRDIDLDYSYICIVFSKRISTVFVILFVLIRESDQTSWLNAGPGPGISRSVNNLQSWVGNTDSGSGVKLAKYPHLIWSHLNIIGLKQNDLRVNKILTYLFNPIPCVLVIALESLHDSNSCLIIQLYLNNVLKYSLWIIKLEQLQNKCFPSYQQNQCPWTQEEISQQV